jgi:LmbE family N-acetylglucosaminyl deacetylase
MRIAVVAAHPDDEVLGCGATVARLTAEGHEAVFLILGEGATSRYADRESASPGEVNRLEQDARTAAGLVGVTDVRFGGFPDNRFDSVPLLECVKTVEALIDEWAPSAVYTHHPGDLNIDHLVVFRAVMAATRPQAGQPVRDVYAFEVASSTEWAFGRLEPVFRPSVFVDVSGTLERKIAAMESYGSEARPWPHPRSPEALRAIAARWGATVGVDAAEAFELVRSVR